MNFQDFTCIVRPYQSNHPHVKDTWSIKINLLKRPYYISILNRSYYDLKTDKPLYNGHYFILKTNYIHTNFKSF